MKTNKLNSIDINNKNLNPNDINDMIGFDFLFPKNSVINKIIENKNYLSILFFGPPGSGKSLSIELLLKKLNVEYFIFNSTTDNKSDLINILEKASVDNKIFLVIEEIHRLNKDKQDLLLFYLEKEMIFLFATTTENPFFVVNPAIRSRLYLYQMKKMSQNILINELSKYLTRKKINIDNEIIESIIYKSNCDFRQIYIYINIVLNLYKNSSKEEILDNIFSFHNSDIDIGGTNFYDILSAYHKSIRGSDPDAAIYYLALLLEDGNLNPIFRRMYAIAYEDIGLSNPKIGPNVHAAIEAAKAIGMPEARIPLASITIELALSPKSNTAINAIDSAISLLRKNIYQPPHHIRDSHYSNAKNLGVTGYKYPHNYKNNWVDQEYLPNEIKKEKFYVYNKYSIYEKKLFEYWYKIKNGEK